MFLSETKDVDSIFNSLVTNRPCAVKQFKENCLEYFIC